MVQMRPAPIGREQALVRSESPARHSPAFPAAHVEEAPEPRYLKFARGRIAAVTPAAGYRRLALSAAAMRAALELPVAAPGPGSPSAAKANICPRSTPRPARRWASPLAQHQPTRAAQRVRSKAAQRVPSNPTQLRRWASPSAQRQPTKAAQRQPTKTAQHQPTRAAQQQGKKRLGSKRQERPDVRCLASKRVGWR